MRARVALSGRTRARTALSGRDALSGRIRARAALNSRTDYMARARSNLKWAREGLHNALV